MSKKLEELFNIAPKEDKEEVETTEIKKTNLNELKTLSESIDKIDAALPSVKDLTAADEEMDELAALSKQAFNDLLDMGLSVDPRFGGKLLEVAATMMSNSITAKQAKIDKKLRMVELQLRKAALDQKERALESKKEPEEETTSKGIIMDRNALLRELLDQADKDKKK
jgi:hypothetical protein